MKKFNQCARLSMCDVAALAVYQVVDVYNATAG
jgi:hypothetical protein